MLQCCCRLNHGGCEWWLSTDFERGNHGLFKGAVWENYEYPY